MERKGPIPRASSPAGEESPRADQESMLPTFSFKILSREAFLIIRIYANLISEGLIFK